MPYNKITTGFVVQQFDDDHNPISQEFVAGDQVEYETLDGEPRIPEIDDPYFPFDMVQPK